MNNELPELLPCPFCGGETEHEGGGKCCAVACVKCGTCSGWQGSEAEAIAAWNARAAVEQAKPTTAADRVCECGGQRAHLAGDPGYSCKSPPAAQPAQVTEALRWIAEYADKPEKAARGPHRGMAAIKYVAEQALTAAQQPGGE